jgi:hypothetical protein
MNKIVRRTRVAAWIARRRLARLFGEALPAKPRYRAAEVPSRDWPRFPPF